MNQLATDYDQGLWDGKLLVQVCNACQQPTMYPKFRCPSCFSADLGWKPSAGTGTLYSFTVQYLGAPSTFADQLPYALAVVRLAEGVQLLGRLVPDEDGTWDSYDCDGPVEFIPTAPAEGQRPCAWFRRA